MGVVSILDRLGKILESNVNDVLDKLENPEKMVKQLLVDARQDLADVKEETVNIRGDLKGAERDLEDCKKRIEKYAKGAKAALEAGNEADACIQIEAKQQQEAALPQLQTAYDNLKDTADKLTQVHNKLVDDIKELEARQNGVKRTMSAARAQESANKLTERMSKGSDAMEAMGRWEAKANSRLDRAEAAAEMNLEMESTDADALAAKYGAGSVSSVDEELERMKAELAGSQTE